MEMTIESVDLGPRACFLDTYMIVRDGHSLSSNVLGIYCEPDTNRRNISSSGSKMLVEIIRSWQWLLRSTVIQESPGFKARYRARQLNSGGLYVLFLSRRVKGNNDVNFPDLKFLVLHLSYLFFYTDAPQYSLPLQRVTVLKWGDATLWCQAQGAPAPVITWRKDGKVLQNSTSVRYTISAWEAKEGDYECLATNSFGEKRKKLVAIQQSETEFAINLIDLKFVTK